MEEEIKYRPLNEKLSECPPEFLLYAEAFKDKQFKKIIQIVNEMIGNGGIDSLPDEYNASFMSMLNFVYSWGFYAGLDYTLAPLETLPKNDII